MKYQEIEGDLISLAQDGRFDVIAHGCNCFCRMRRGIAPQMVRAFSCDKYPLERLLHKGDINKLGRIEYYRIELKDKEGFNNNKFLNVINAYTQYDYRGINNIDYEALTLCMRKINHKFRNLHIGLPKIGAGLAGGDWNKIKEIIQRELKDCNVTIVIYKE